MQIFTSTLNYSSSGAVLFTENVAIHFFICLSLQYETDSLHLTHFTVWLHPTQSHKKDKKTSLFLNLSIADYFHTVLKLVNL